MRRSRIPSSSLMPKKRAIRSPTTRERGAMTSRKEAAESKLVLPAAAKPGAYGASRSVNFGRLTQRCSDNRRAIPTNAAETKQQVHARQSLKTRCWSGRRITRPAQIQQPTTMAIATITMSWPVLLR